MECESQIDITQFKVPLDDVVSVYSNIVNDNPDLFFVSSSIGYNYYPATNTIANLFPRYSMSKSEISAAKELFNRGASKALAFIDDGMTDLQKAIVLHDFVCETAHYPQVDLKTQDQDIYHSAYGLFYDGEVVCAGYTLAYSYLMMQAGVPCEYVASDPMGHAWNKVFIDGYWYNVDTTWDDLDFSCTVSLKGSVGHSCFLKSDSKFNTQECSFHYSGVTYDSCTADSTRFDSAFWDNVYSKVCYSEGDLFYLKPNTQTGYTTLTRVASDFSETSVKSLFCGIVSSFSSNVKDSDGNVYTNQKQDVLARITPLDNRFYITANKKIYSVNTQGNTYQIETTGSFCYGVSADDAGNLIYQTDTATGEIVTLEKLLYFHNYQTTEKGVNYHNYPDINYDYAVNAKDYATILHS